MTIEFRIARIDAGDGAVLVAWMRDEMRERRGQALGRRSYEPIANFNANPVATFFGSKRLSEN